MVLWMKKEDSRSYFLERLELHEENVFVVSFMNSMIKNPEMHQNLKLLQIGESIINPENSIGSNQEFRNSVR